MTLSKIVPASVLALVFVTGCPATDETGDTDIACTNSFQAFPEDGTTDAYYRTAIDAKLQIAEPTASLALTDSADAAVAGASAVNANHVTFTPTAPLTAGGVYTATLSYTCGTASWSFTVSEVGSAIPTTVDLAGKAYALDLAHGRFVHPEGVGDLLGQFLTTDILVGVDAATATTIDMVGAIGVADATTPTQDTCSPTIPFPQASFTENPFFEINAQGQSTPISVAGYTVSIDDLILSGAFAPDASYIAGARLAGSIDTYPLAGLVDPTCVPTDTVNYPACLDGVCQLAAVIGGCEACASDGEAHCLSLDVDSIGAEGISGSLVVRTQDDICADSTCADTDCPPPM